MFYCPACGEWIVETALSRILGAEVGKLEHDIEKHHPEWAGLLAVAAPVVTFVLVAWAGPRLYRWLKEPHTQVEPVCPRSQRSSAKGWS